MLCWCKGRDIDTGAADFCVNGIPCCNHDCYTQAIIDVRRQTTSLRLRDADEHTRPPLNGHQFNGA